MAGIGGNVLFIGIEGTPSCYYRCVLPARALGADWVGLTQDFAMLSGEVGGEFKKPNVFDYETVVCQYPAGYEWEARLADLRQRGVRIVFEIDDYLHGIKEVKEHTFYNFFSQRIVLRAIERCMGMSDALIVSTKFLAERYRKLVPGPVHVCPNGIDPERFDLHRAPRGYMSVGMAGATGHVAPLLKWLNGGVLEAIYDHPTARLTTIGVHTAIAEAAIAGMPDRVTGVPFAEFYAYPASMLDADVLLAPLGDTKWHRGKSDLRWLEASALGIPCVCDARGYPEATLRAATPGIAGEVVREMLRQGPERARELGEEARAHVLAQRSFPQAAEPWREALGI